MTAYLTLRDNIGSVIPDVCGYVGLINMSEIIARMWKEDCINMIHWWIMYNWLCNYPYDVELLFQLLCVLDYNHSSPYYMSK